MTFKNKRNLLIRKMSIIFVSCLVIFSASGCSNTSYTDNEQYDTENRQYNTNTEQYDMEDNVSSNETTKSYSNFNEYWNSLEQKYKLVTYKKIISKKCPDSYVLIDGIVNNVSYDKSIKCFNYDVYYKYKNGYIVSTDELIFNTKEYAENKFSYSKIKKIKNGNKIRFCVYVNSDNSFGSDIKALKIIDNKKTKISNIKVLNPNELETIDSSENDWSIYTLKYNELLDVKTNGKKIIIKAKLLNHGSKKNNINSAYSEVVDLIKKDLKNKYTELQYWAVADMTNGNTDKVISFTVNKQTIKAINSGKIYSSNLSNYLEDLYLHYSLK